MKLVRRQGSGALALLTPAVPVVLGLAGALFLAPGGEAASNPPVQSTVREIWVAAVPIGWNVVPNTRNAIERERFRPEDTTMTTVVYRRFTRDWERRWRDPEGALAAETGLAGPVLRARVGETLLVHFKNLDNETNKPHSMHFHGVEYRPGSDGAYIPGFSGPGANVKPGDTFTYRLVAGKGSTGVWPYHDHSSSMADSIAGGMYGALSILGRKERPPDREFLVFLSHHLGFMTINGRAFVGNTPTFKAKVGDLVQWDVLTLGDDFHTFHVHGHRWKRAGTPEDTRTVGPAESFRVRWVEDAPGTWPYHCHVEGHMMEGMIGLYRVSR